MRFNSIKRGKRNSSINNYQTDYQHNTNNATSFLYNFQKLYRVISGQGHFGSFCFSNQRHSINANVITLIIKLKTDRERTAFPIYTYFPMQKCLKILFSVSWLLICPPVISPNSSNTIFRSSAMMSPLMPISIDSNTRERESWARSRAS